jgi:hypothetical protein
MIWPKFGYFRATSSTILRKQYRNEKFLGEQEMNRKAFFIILPLMALLLMSCRLSAGLSRQTLQGSGNLKTEQRPVSNIGRVSLEGIGDVTVIQGSEESLTVEADDNILPYVETLMRGSELVLRIKEGYNIRMPVTVRYTLKVKDLNRISISGSGSVTSEKFDSNDLTLNITGSGKMKFADLQAQNLRTMTSGSGNYDLKGKVESQNITITGMSHYSAGDLQSSEASVTISGSGDVTLWVKDKLDVTILGAGNVDYYGNPTVNQSITGGGKVKSLGSHQ